MMGKQEQLDRIKKGDAKVRKMLREGKRGPELDDLLNQIIKWEALYEKRFGRDPCAQLR